MVTITKYVWDTVSDCVLSELDENNAVKAVYTNEPQQYGGVLSQRRGTTSHYHHHDALGSTRFLTDSSGNVTDTYLHDAWGNLVSSTGTTVNPFKWVGKYGYYTDDGTGQVYVRARMYQPTAARWESLDSLWFTDGLNLFAYVSGDPVYTYDPSGNFGDKKNCDVLSGPTVLRDKSRDKPNTLVTEKNNTGLIHIGFAFSVQTSFSYPCQCCNYKQLVSRMTKMYFTDNNGTKHPANTTPESKQFREDCQQIGGVTRCPGDHDWNSKDNSWLHCTLITYDGPGVYLDRNRLRGMLRDFGNNGSLTVEMHYRFCFTVEDPCCVAFFDPPKSLIESCHIFDFGPRTFKISALLKQLEAERPGTN